jgi:hypothetical protein
MGEKGPRWSETGRSLRQIKETGRWPRRPETQHRRQGRDQPAWYVEGAVNHFTDLDGYNGIWATRPVWTFHAGRPPGDHPFGAYFTTLASDTPNLAEKLRIPRRKLAQFFSFQDVADLTPLRGGRGQWVFYATNTYPVDGDRQLDHGWTGL